MMEHVRISGTPDRVFSVAALATTPAGRSKSLIAMGGQYLLGFGPVPRKPPGSWRTGSIRSKPAVA